jgi:hypothetical protein
MPSLPAVLVYVVVCVVDDAWAALEHVNRRVVLDSEGVWRRDAVGRQRCVASWDQIASVVWRVYRGPVFPICRVTLELGLPQPRLRRALLWGGADPRVGRPICDAVVRRLGFHDETPARPQSSWAAAVVERKEYSVWRKQG